MLLTTSMIGVAALAISSPAVADTTNLSIRVADCNGCTVTAVHSVHPGWESIDDSVIWRRSAKVRKGVVRLSVPTHRTRGLSFELYAGKYSAGNAVPMVALHYANQEVGSKVNWFESTQGKRASYCWAGTTEHKATIRVRTQRWVNPRVPVAAPERHMIRVWAGRTLATLRDDMNMLGPLDDGILGIQQGPYCFDSGLTAAANLAGRVPSGGSVWIKPTGGTYQLLRLWRSGSRLRLYRDEGNYPGDGSYCSWGTLRGKKFVGKEQRLAPEPVRVKYTVKKKGGRLKVLGLTGNRADDRLPWRRGSLQKYFQLVPKATGNTGEWCRTFKPMG